jgi:hypothetical protein
VFGALVAQRPGGEGMPEPVHQLPDGGSMPGGEWWFRSPAGRADERRPGVRRPSLLAPKREAKLLRRIGPLFGVKADLPQLDR